MHGNMHLITLWVVTQNTQSNENLLFMFYTYTGGPSVDCFNKYVNKAMNEWTQFSKPNVHSNSIVCWYSSYI